MQQGIWKGCIILKIMRNYLHNSFIFVWVTFDFFSYFLVGSNQTCLHLYLNLLFFHRRIMHTLAVLFIANMLVFFNKADSFLKWQTLLQVLHVYFYLFLRCSELENLWQKNNFWGAALLLLVTNISLLPVAVLSSFNFRTTYTGLFNCHPPRWLSFLQTLQLFTAFVLEGLRVDKRWERCRPTVKKKERENRLGEKGVWEKGGSWWD